MRTVYNATQDASLLAAAWEPLLQEHAYWTSDPKVITVQLPGGSQYNFSRYYAEWDMPRPESYLCVPCRCLSWGQTHTKTDMSRISCGHACMDIGCCCC